MPLEIIAIQPGVPCNHEVEDTVSLRLQMPAENFVANHRVALEPLQRQIFGWLADFNWFVGHVLHKVGKIRANVGVDVDFEGSCAGKLLCFVSQVTESLSFVWFSHR